MGERTPLAVIDAPASGRMAVGEAITNLLAAPIERSSASSSAATGWPRAATAGRRRRALRHGERGRHGAVPGARHQRPGRQGQPVDAHALARRGGEAKQVTAPVSPDRHRVRDDRRRAPALTPQLAARRHDAAARRPRPRSNAHGRLDPRADDAASSATPCPTWTTRRCCARSSTRVPRLRDAGLAARVPRPQRRRPVGGGVRDGVRRTRRREPQRRPARHARATASPTAAPSTATPRTGPRR